MFTLSLLLCITALAIIHAYGDVEVFRRSWDDAVAKYEADGRPLLEDMSVGAMWKAAVTAVAHNNDSKILCRVHITLPLVTSYPELFIVLYSAD
jgi:hypothetical protein